MKTRTIILATALATSIIGNLFHLSSKNVKKTDSSERMTESLQYNPETEIVMKKEVWEKNQKQLQFLTQEIDKLEIELKEEQQHHNKLKQLAKEQFINETQLVNINNEKQLADEAINNIDENSQEYEEIKQFVMGLRKNDQLVADFFSQFDTSSLDENEDKLFNKFLTQMKEIDKLKKVSDESDNIMEAMNRTEEIIMKTMQVHGLKVARKVAMNSLAADLGYKNEDIVKFVDYIDYIYKNTSATGAIDDLIGNGDNPIIDTAIKTSIEE